jgi:hypothetical protein
LEKIIFLNGEIKNNYDDVNIGIKCKINKILKREEDSEEEDNEEEFPEEVTPKIPLKCNSPKQKIPLKPTKK